MTAIDLATAYANAGKALLDLADALTASPDAPGAPSFEDLPFDDTPQGRSEGGGCPVHDMPWSIREAGTSKATGQPYNAFWKCDAQNADGSYCKQKPTPAWVKAHPAR